MSKILDRFESILKNLLAASPEQKIKSMSVTWKEMGEYQGELVLPVITIVFNNDEE